MCNFINQVTCRYWPRMCILGLDVFQTIYKVFHTVFLILVYGATIGFLWYLTLKLFAFPIHQKKIPSNPFFFFSFLPYQMEIGTFPINKWNYVLGYNFHYFLLNWLGWHHFVLQMARKEGRCKRREASCVLEHNFVFMR